MKTSLDHLPQEKRDKLGRIVEILRHKAPVEMVILFGSHARGDWVEDDETGYMSDFDLLAVVKDPKVAEDGVLWAELEAEARAAAGKTPVTLIAHDARFLNKEIRTGQYFFADVLREGVLLYTTKRVELAKPKAATLEERVALMETYLTSWSTSANEFYANFEFSAGRQSYSIAAFHLHQATERYYAAVLLVFTGYKPRTHNIEELGSRAIEVAPELAGALPRAEEGDRRLFDLLKRAYIEARYSMSYRIGEEELAVLGERVKALAAFVERLCREKIASVR